MNVDGAFILAETRGRPQCFFLLTTACRYFSDIFHYEFGKMFVTRFTLSHAFKKIIKMSKWWVTVFQRRSSSCFGLWTLASRARAALFEYMQFMRVLENRTFCSLFTNRLRPFRDFNHHSNQQQPPFLFSSETWDAALSSLSLSVFRTCNEFCVSLSDRFKCFHTTDVFAALAHASIWSRNVIVRYKLFCLFAYSAEHRNSFFSYFQLNNFGCRTFGASLENNSKILSIFFIYLCI